MAGVGGQVVVVTAVGVGGWAVGAILVVEATVGAVVGLIRVVLVGTVVEARVAAIGVVFSTGAPTVQPNNKIMRVAVNVNLPFAQSVIVTR